MRRVCGAAGKEQARSGIQILWSWRVFQVVGCVWSRFSAAHQSRVVDEGALYGALHKCCVGQTCANAQDES